MKRKELPSITEEENIPFNLKPSLFGGFVCPDESPAPFTLNDVIKINKLYHNGSCDVAKLSKAFSLKEDLIRRIIVRFDEGDFNKFLKNYRNLDVLDLDDIDFNSNNFTKDALKKLDLFIFHKRLSKSDEEISELLDLNLDDIKDIIEYGKSGIMPYYTFYQDYKDAEAHNALADIQKDFNESSQLIQTFISYLYRGISEENISKLTGIDLEKVQKWLDLGKEKTEPFDKFYDDYLEALEFNGNINR